MSLLTSDINIAENVLRWLEGRWPEGIALWGLERRDGHLWKWRVGLWSFVRSAVLVLSGCDAVTLPTFSVLVDVWIIIC